MWVGAEVVWLQAHTHTHAHACVHTAPLAWVRVDAPIQVIIQLPVPIGLPNLGQHQENTILWTMFSRLRQ